MSFNKKEKMDGKKGIYFGLLLLTATLVVSGVASGIFHKEPELSPFNASVSITNDPPVVTFVHVTDINGFTDEVFPIINSTASALVTFIAEDPNGAGDLDDTSGFVDLTGPPSVNAARDSGSTCSQVACPSCTGIQANFSCTVQMQYYDLNGTNAWNVNASIADDSGTRTENNTHFFDYNGLIAFEILNESIAWTGIGIGAGDINQTADSTLVIENLGNVFVSNIDINASQLNGTGANPEQVIPASDFSGSANSGLGDPQCDSTGVTANPFIQSINVPMLDVSLVVTTDLAIVEEDLFYCIYPSLQPLGLSVIQSYSTTEEGTRAWELTLA